MDARPAHPPKQTLNLLCSLNPTTSPLVEVTDLQAMGTSLEKSVSDNPRSSKSLLWAVSLLIPGMPPRCWKLHHIDSCFLNSENGSHSTGNGVTGSCRISREMKPVAIW